MKPRSGRFEFEATGRSRIVSGPTPCHEFHAFVKSAAGGYVYVGEQDASHVEGDESGAELYNGDELKVTADAGETVDLYDWWFSGEEGDVITWLALK